VRAAIGEAFQSQADPGAGFDGRVPFSIAAQLRSPDGQSRRRAVRRRGSNLALVSHAYCRAAVARSVAGVTLSERRSPEHEGCSWPTRRPPSLPTGWVCRPPVCFGAHHLAGVFGPFGADTPAVCPPTTRPWRVGSQKRVVRALGATGARR
jgi:hypothetical protein